MNSSSLSSDINNNNNNTNDGGDDVKIEFDHRDISRYENIKYFYIHERKCSYPIESILSAAMKRIEEAFPRNLNYEEKKNVLEKNAYKSVVIVPYTSIRSYLFADKIYKRGEQDNISYIGEQELRKMILEDLFVFGKVIPDLSKHYGQETCPITLENFDELGDSNVCIFNLNRRKYGLNGLINYIKTIKPGVSLRLEDTVIHPMELRSVKLYLYSYSEDIEKDNTQERDECIRAICERLGKKMGSGYDKEIHAIPDIISMDQIKARPFDSARLNTRENINGGVLDLGKVISEATGDIMKFEKVYAFYAKARNLSEYNMFKIVDQGRDAVVSDCRVTNVTLFPSHPKMNLHTFVFDNVRFENCTIEIVCFCGVSFFGCLFKNCIINSSFNVGDATVSSTKHLFLNCQWKDCTFNLKCGNCSLPKRKHDSDPEYTLSTTAAPPFLIMQHQHIKKTLFYDNSENAIHCAFNLISRDEIKKSATIEGEKANKKSKVNHDITKVEEESEEEEEEDENDNYSSSSSPDEDFQEYDSDSY